MNRSTCRTLAARATLLLSVWFATLPAQSATATIAAAAVRAQAPANDDPDALVRELVTVALTQRRSPVAFLLVDEALRLIGQVQDPRALREWLRNLPNDEPAHGRLAQRLRELGWYSSLAIDGTGATGPAPAAGYAHAAVVAGPFGDSGDHFVGVPFAPELRFPAIGSEWPGRGRIARVTPVTNRTYDDYLELDRFWPGAEGCWYGLLRVAVDAAVDTFLEIDCPGDHQVFVDEREVLRIERWRTTSNRHDYIPLHLPPGEHTVLLKAASGGQCKVTARFVDAECQADTAVRPVPIVDSTLGPTGERATVRPDRYVAASDVWSRAAAAAEASDEIRIAALLQALHDGNDDLALQHVEPLRARPPADPLVALAFANVLRSTSLPDEVRKAEARRLVERAAPALGDAHHAARLARAQLLEEQDQREEALRLLAAHPAAGPATWERRHGLVRQLRFRAEIEPVALAWSAACPSDPRPLLSLAELAGDAGDTARALQLRQRAIALRVDRAEALRAAFRDALALGEFPVAERLLDLLDPPTATPPPPGRLWSLLELATARGDAAAATAHALALRTHAELPASWCPDLAAHCLRRGDRSAALACLQRGLELDPDQPNVRDWQRELAGAADASPFAAFRRDGAAAAAAFQAGEAESGASTTLVVDQRIVDVQPDGSWLAEVHAVHRINDQAGVEAFSSGAGIGRADEVLLVRTLATDGKQYVPARIEDDYTLQQLQPGAFVEWRVRERGAAPGADPVTTEAFFFGATDSPTVCTELVVVLPKDHRGELRTRALGEPAETRTLPDGRQAQVFRREQVARLAPERFRPPAFDLLPSAQLGEDRARFAEHRQRRIGLLDWTRPTAPIVAKAREIVGDRSEPRDRTAALWSWCQREIDTGQARKPLETLSRGKGDRFLLLVALLRAADLHVVPLIAANQRAELGDGQTSLFATENPLDATGAAVLLPNGERQVLFADTPRHWPLGAVPGPRGGAEALLLHDDHEEALLLPIGDHAQALRIRGKATLRPKDLRLEVTAELGDEQGFALAERLREQKENVQKLAARQIAQQLFTGFRIESASLQLATTDAPLQLRATLLRSGVQRNGDRLVVPLPLPETRYTASFGDRSERTLPFRMALDLFADWQIDLTLGDDVRVAALPPASEVLFAPLSFTQQCSLRDGVLTIRRRSQIGAASLPAAAFGDWLRALAAADRAEKATIELITRP